MSNDDEATVELIRLTDAVEAEMLRDFIRQEGLFCATPGMNHRAVLGMAGGYVEIVVRVKRAELEEAKRLLEAFRGGEVVAGEGFDDEGFDPDDAAPGHADVREGEEPAPRSASPRLKRIAAFCSLGLPAGCGHLYARRYPQGFALLAASALLFIVVIPLQLSLFAWLYPALMLADLFGAFVAVDDFNGVERRDSVATLLRPLPFAVAALVVAGPALLFAHPTLFAPARVELVCEASARCSSRALDRCQERAAVRFVEGRLDADFVESCARCIEQHSANCEETLRCSEACRDYIVPARPDPSPSGWGLDVPGLLEPVRSPDELDVDW